MIRATPDMVAPLCDFFRQHLDRAMFPLSNIAQFGFDGAHDYAMRFWVALQGGVITDAVGLANSGALMPVCPNGDWAAVRAALQGEAVARFMGPSEQVRPLIAACGMAHAPTTLNDDDGHYALDLAASRLPDGPGQIVPIADAPEQVVRDWLLQYEMEALQTPPVQAAKDADFSYTEYCQHQSHVVLMDGDTPLAMTGFNARIPEAVQIGGVFTPAGLRGRGYARRALALHLAQAREAGVRRASLFAASESAARAYMGIGFERIGDWTLFMMVAPQVVAS
ncbi:MAG: GNAT family N-acetyltransferase [Paracoccaceae bacterium]